MPPASAQRAMSTPPSFLVLLQSHHLQNKEGSLLRLMVASTYIYQFKKREKRILKRGGGGGGRGKTVNNKEG